MNTLVALTSTAVNPRVPTKLSLDAPRLCCSLGVLCDNLAPAIRVYWLPTITVVLQL
jgi:hypothetical protein